MSSTLKSASSLSGPKRSKTREAILAAAIRVMSQHGIANLTLDSVAREAKVSKGGLLYHFASKDELIVSLLDENAKDFQDSVKGEVESGPPAQGALFRAYVKKSFKKRSNRRRALIAAIILNPQVLINSRERRKMWQQQLEADGASPALAELAHLAALGLGFADFTNYCPPDDNLREQMVELLISRLA